MTGHGQAEPPLLRVPIDQPLAPAALGPLELADRQGVEKLIGDQEQRPRRHVRKPVVPDRRRGEARVRQHRLLRPAERPAGFHQMHPDRLDEARQGASGA
jgi:hypothetical protein